MANQRILMTNMELVAEMLGVEVGKNFEIIKISQYGLSGAGTFCFTKDAFLHGEDPAPDYLYKLLTNECSIKEHTPKRWEPKGADTYHWINKAGCVHVSYWNGDYEDNLKLVTGNCFRTSEEITPEVKERVLLEIEKNSDKGW